MRTLNISLISATGAFALLLTSIAYPTLGERPLSHWALNVGAFSSASLISLLYIFTSLIPPLDHKKSHSVVLTTYFICLVIATFTGAFWGVVGHVMETEKVDFETAFWHVEIMIYSGYILTTAILSSTLFYIIKQRRNLVQAAVSV